MPLVILEQAPGLSRRGTQKANLEVTVIARTRFARKAEKIENYFAGAAGHRRAASGNRIGQERGSARSRPRPVLDIAWEDGFSVPPRRRPISRCRDPCHRSGAQSAGAFRPARMEGKGVSYCAVCDGSFSAKSPCRHRAANTHCMSAALVPLAKTGPFSPTQKNRRPNSPRAFGRRTPPG